MPTIKPAKKLLNADGSESTVTAGEIAVSALTANFKDEKLTEEEKIRRWCLAKGLKQTEALDLSEEDAKMVKGLVNRAFATTTFGSFVDAME